MAILLVFYNDAQGAEQSFLRERSGHRALVTNVQVFHGFPPRLQYDGEGAWGLMSAPIFAGLVAPYTPGCGTPDPLFYGLRL
jgi:hypothetical protein